MAMAGLLQAVSQWKRMDCLWSEEDYLAGVYAAHMCCAAKGGDVDGEGRDTRLVVLAQHHVDTLVALVSAVDAEQLQLPHLVETLLTALEDTVAAFAATCVSHASLRTLVSVMFYAIQSDSTRMQCAGMETCVQVVEYMATQIQEQQQHHMLHTMSSDGNSSSSPHNHAATTSASNKSSDEGAAVARYHALCAELLQLVLRCLGSSKFTLDTARAVARVVWTVSRAAAAAGEELSTIFVRVAEELPRAAQSMEELYTSLTHMLVAAGGGVCREGDVLSQLERLLSDLMASLRGVDVV